MMNAEYTENISKDGVIQLEYRPASNGGPGSVVLRVGGEPCLLPPPALCYEAPCESLGWFYDSLTGTREGQRVMTHHAYTAIVKWHELTRRVEGYPAPSADDLRHLWEVTVPELLLSERR